MIEFSWESERKREFVNWLERETVVNVEEEY